MRSCKDNSIKVSVHLLETGIPFISEETGIYYQNKLVLEVHYPQNNRTTFIVFFDRDEIFRLTDLEHLFFLMMGAAVDAHETKFKEWYQNTYDGDSKLEATREWKLNRDRYSKIMQLFDNEDQFNEVFDILTA